MKTPEERLKIYEQAIEDYKNMSLVSAKAFCNYFDYEHNVSIDEFPELMRNKPKDNFMGGYWFTINDVENRIKVLQRSIIDVKTIINHNSSSKGWLELQIDNNTVRISKSLLAQHGYTNNDIKCSNALNVPKITYETVCELLFDNKLTFFTETTGKISKIIGSITTYVEPNNGTKKQLEGLMALNKLMNVARYLNNDEVIVWDANTQHHTIVYNTDKKEISFGSFVIIKSGIPYFKSLELAKQAIEILGEEEVIKAITWSY